MNIPDMFIRLILLLDEVCVYYKLNYRETVLCSLDENPSISYYNICLESKSTMFEMKHYSLLVRLRGGCSTTSPIRGS
jgi:hypothetical protein